MSLTELIGQATTLTVARLADFGYFLTDGNEDVLLHKNQAQQELAEGDEVEVFLFTDSQGRLSASMTIPELCVGTYAWVKVTDTNPKIGVFLNIGLPKDILLGADDLPAHQSVWPKVGDMVYITLRANRSNLLYARLASDQVIQSISIEAAGFTQ
jgi:predicted RNA-binding protein (virulence factor B family)